MQSAYFSEERFGFLPENGLSTEAFVFLQKCAYSPFFLLDLRFDRGDNMEFHPEYSAVQLRFALLGSTNTLNSKPRIIRAGLPLYAITGWLSMRVLR